MKVFVEDDESCRRWMIIPRVDPVKQDSSLFCIKLSTNYPKFIQNKSCVLRSFSSFYSLSNFLSSFFMDVPGLPPKHLLWSTSGRTKMQHLTIFLGLVISRRDLLDSKGIHLFMQTQLSMEAIKEDVENIRKEKINKEQIELSLAVLKTKHKNLRGSCNKTIDVRNRRKSFGDHLALLNGNICKILPRWKETSDI